jgi:hypothetical protein
MLLPDHGPTTRLDRRKTRSWDGFPELQPPVAVFGNLVPGMLAPVLAKRSNYSVGCRLHGCGPGAAQFEP